MGYWKLETTEEVLSEADRNHIAKKIKEGFRAGEIVKREEV